MNLIIKRYKILIISFSMFFLIFNCFKPQKVNAIALVDDVVVAGGITVSTSAILALAGTTLVAGGVVLDSTFNDSDVCKYVVSKMIATGESAQYLSVKILENGKQFLTWTQSGINWFCDTFQNSVVSPSLSIDGRVITFYSKPFNESGVYYRYFNVGTITVPIDTNISFDFVGSSLVSLQALTTYYIRILQHYKGTWSIQFSTSLTFDNYTHSGSVPVDTSSVCMSEKPIPADSICPTPRDAVRNWDSSSSQDVIGGTLDGAYNPSVGVPLTGGSVGVLNPAIDYPYGKTWDDLFPNISIPKDTDTDVPDIDVPSDTTGDITGEGGSWVLNIPILGDILRVLMKILELLKTFIKTLIDALVSAITTLFVPSDTYFIDKFDGYRTTLIGKLGDNNFDFLQQSGSNIEDIYINIFGQQVCIVKITLFNKFKDFAFIVIRAFFYFFLILFNFNQVIKFLRGSIFSDYNSRESMAILQNNDNLDKIINNV